MQREIFNLKLKSTRNVTPTVLHMVFEREDAKVLDFIPGQFITFHFEIGGVEYNRSYSIATIPGKSNDIEIAVSPFPGGPGTEYLFALKTGDLTPTTGPFGRLILRDEAPKRYIMVATGTGVTPYRSMLPELVKRMQKYNTCVDILLGVQKPEDLLYGEDFIAFHNKYPHLNFHACYSRQMPKEPQEYEYSGYVQAHFDVLKVNPDEDIIYLCGNPDMIDNAFNLLREQGFETKQIRREKYISPKR